MPPNRRRFLVTLGVALVALAAGVAARRRTLVPWVFSAGLSDEAPGPISPAVARTLEVTVLTLLDPRVETGHYLELFRWRAAHVPGARALYTRFARTVNRAATGIGQREFVSAPADVRQRILAAFTPARGVTRVRRTLVGRDEARFARHVVREIFRCFARTDAWRLAGYAAWPGMPRAILRLEPPPPSRDRP